MATETVIGVVGDFNSANETHRLTNDALVALELHFEWVPTETIVHSPAVSLGAYAGVFISPGSPYKSMAGALAAIQHARQSGLPLVGT
jgi:CTP synthase (UTP-ammonia lyase)